MDRRLVHPYPQHVGRVHLGSQQVCSSQFLDMSPAPAALETRHCALGLLAEGFLCLMQPCRLLQQCIRCGGRRMSGVLKDEGALVSQRNHALSRQCFSCDCRRLHYLSIQGGHDLRGPESRHHRWLSGTISRPPVPNQSIKDALYRVARHTNQDQQAGSASRASPAQVWAPIRSAKGLIFQPSLPEE